MTTTPAEALVAAGLVVHDVRVDPRPGLWMPIGVLNHHTGTKNPPKPGRPASLDTCRYGRADLPGPLCQWVVSGHDGSWWWITEGRANHAGKGDKDVWAWLLSNGRPDDPPVPNDVENTTDGNSHLVGVEVEGSGDWTSQVHDSVLRGNRALLGHYKARVDNALAHKEWTHRKPDPAGIDMPAFRRWLRTRNQGDDMLTGPEHDALMEIRDIARNTQHLNEQHYQEKTLQMLEAHINNPHTGGGAGQVDVAKFREEIADELAARLNS